MSRREVWASHSSSSSFLCFSDEFRNFIAGPEPFFKETVKKAKKLVYELRKPIQVARPSECCIAQLGAMGYPPDGNRSWPAGVRQYLEGIFRAHARGNRGPRVDR